MFNRNPTPYILASILFLCYLFIGYKIQRHETLPLLSAYGILFGIYCWIILKVASEQIQFWLYSAFVFRLILLFAVPNLSDDFFRFIWDGRLLASGYHPFAHIPSFYIENKISIPGIDESLFLKLNSKSYFTIYPPAAQFIFWIAVKVSSSIYGSLLVLKAFIFFAEAGSIVLIRKLLDRYKLPSKNVIIYALNPLVILELMGNVHLEAIMTFFLLLSCYLLVRQHLLLAAIAFAVSICTKLIPLVFLPALLPLLSRKRAVLFYSITALACLVLFLPLLDKEIIIGFKNSLGYYFSRFEFNASIYYLMRELGFAVYGYNIVGTVGWKLGVIATALILIVSISRWSIVRSPWLISNKLWAMDQSPLKGHRQWTIDYRIFTLFHVMMGALLIYFLFTTTLHPWYIITLLVLSVFTNYRFVILWTGLIFLSYAGYTSDGFEENLWLVVFEYMVVLGYLANELWKRNQPFLSS